MSLGVQLGMNYLYVSQELGMDVGDKLQMYVDAAAAISFANNVGPKTRMKHLDMRMDWIQELRDKGKLEIIKVDTKDQRADPLTKLLDRIAFKHALQFIQSDIDTPPDLN